MSSQEEAAKTLVSMKGDPRIVEELLPEGCDPKIFDKELAAVIALTLEKYPDLSGGSRRRMKGGALLENVKAVLAAVCKLVKNTTAATGAVPGDKLASAAREIDALAEDPEKMKSVARSIYGAFGAVGVTVALRDLSNPYSYISAVAVALLKGLNAVTPTVIPTFAQVESVLLNAASVGIAAGPLAGKALIALVVSWAIRNVYRAAAPKLEEAKRGAKYFVSNEGFDAIMLVAFEQMLTALKYSREKMGPVLEALKTAMTAVTEEEGLPDVSDWRAARKEFKDAVARGERQLPAGFLAALPDDDEGGGRRKRTRKHKRRTARKHTFRRRG